MCITEDNAVDAKWQTRSDDGARYAGRVAGCIYLTLMNKVLRHKCSLLLDLPSPTLVTYPSSHSREGDTHLNERFERVLEK